MSTVLAARDTGEGGSTFWFGDLPIRARLINGDPWFVLADLCVAIGVREDGALSRLPENEKSSILIGQPGKSDILVHAVSEPGMYRVIMRSDKPAAERFVRWIAHDVLPAIRKTGSYGTEKLSRRQLAQMVIDAEDRVEALQSERDKAWNEIERNGPKVDFVDSFVNPFEDCCTIRTLAKELGVAERRLFAYLIDRKRIYKDRNGMYQPYAAWVKWFRLRDQPDVPRLHNDQVRTTLYVLPPGKEGIRQMLLRDPADG